MAPQGIGYQQAQPGVIPIGPDPGRVQALQQALTAGRRRQPQTAIEGLGQGAESIVSALMLKKERKKGAARDQAFSDQGAAFMEALSGGLGSALRKFPGIVNNPNFAQLAGLAGVLGPQKAPPPKKRERIQDPDGRWTYIGRRVLRITQL